MEKLVELLNEFDKKKLILSGIEFGLWSIKEDAGKGLLKYRNYESNASVSYAISKFYGFIERLVENDKIDESKIFCDQGLYYSLLCELAISDTPIEDLISYLKE